MSRSPKEVIKAILGNLAMARDASLSKATKSSLDCRFHDFREEIGATNAFLQCIDLINIEARDILTPPESTEQVRPFNGTQPAL